MIYYGLGGRAGENFRLAEPQEAKATPPMDAVAWVRDRLGLRADELQARVLTTESKRGILNCSRQWGKSTITAAKAVHQAATAEGSLTIVVSPSARQSAEFVRKAAGFVQKLNIRPKGDGDNQTSLALPNGSRIVGLPGTEATIRGFSSAALVIIDEAARVSDDLYVAVRPMLAASDGALWMMSTPWTKRGFFYDTWAKGGAEWERIVAPATECPRIKAAFLEEERRTMGERCFRREYLCQFEDPVNGLFTREMIERLVDPNLLPLEIE